MLTLSSLQGTFTALVTPFVDSPSKTIDWVALDRLLDEQREAKVTGIVVCGTTGESPTLTDRERQDILMHTLEYLKGTGIAVIANIGTHCTQETIERARLAEKDGVHGLMVVTPYYNKPDQEGLFAHFMAVAEAVSCPLILYNVPARTGVDLMTDTIARICDRAPHVLGVKESTGNVLRTQQIVSNWGDRIAVLSGEDQIVLPMIAVGAKGVISVTANLLPAAVGRVVRLGLEGRLEEARCAHLELVAVHAAMLQETNPVPIKAALALQGWIQNSLRLPLVPAKQATRDHLSSVLETYHKRQRERDY
ncbi:4-hydroxy-tetrahydrodipicolinate synthase [Pajaroellobacter abortibovis]|uniref:4-hydroxy-tetrahydrodipicolinate synthase n=1 Tax=Pajaroellobacter abortibovis TaxID=1882918 RepID=A0A1L6MYF3_9BACT|nr:4-hydroxy-tetrahydrodipicolinate synthase [Pajaroellobacter abortibovis]APS00542.1 4-hydroxy-tetrahydrodipicolinate synthase [Pajaroellobacter abortibovis]